MKLVEVELRDEDALITAYQHIDNGGHKFSYDKYGNLTVENGHHGYSHTTLFLSAVDVDGMIQFFTLCKKRMEQEEMLRRLKGE